MGFVAEDGSGLATANSYLSVVDADTFHDDRGNASWASQTDAVKQAALIKATDFLESNWEWVVTQKANSDQALSWPKNGALDRHGESIDSDVVPVPVEQATAFLALEALSNDLVPALTQKQKKVKAGPVEVEYADSASASKKYPYVDGLLAGLVRSMSGVAVSLL